MFNFQGHISIKHDGHRIYLDYYFMSTRFLGHKI